MTIPLIIDTDVALGVHHEGRPRDIDDGFAIAEAINSPEIDLKLVSCVYGNGPIREVHRVAQEIVALKGNPVRVVCGAGEPITASDKSNEAVEAMAAVLRDTPCAVAAIGPLTNMGLLAKRHPDAFTNITSLLVVAGRSVGAVFTLGGEGPVRDFNFENDPVATEMMLTAAQATVPVVMAGFELTSQVCVTRQDLATILTKGSDTARYFYDNSRAWCDHWTETFPSDAGFHPWDSATISYLKHPQHFATEQRGWRIVEQGTAAPHLECGRDLPGEVTYCTGFTEGGANAFVRDVVESVY